MDQYGIYLCETFKQAIRSIPESERADVYAFGMYQSDYDGSVRFSYNTASHIASVHADDVDLNSARWGYAYWPTELPWWYAGSMEDLHILPAGTSWLSVVEDWNSAQVHAMEAAGLEPDLNGPLWDLYCDVARCIHASGIVQELFGRPLQIVMFEDDEGERMEAATRDVNPADALTDYALFMDSVHAESI